MPRVPFPADAKVTRMDFGLTYPGQIRHPLPLTGGEVVLNRGFGRWSGVVQIAPAQGKLAQEIEAMFGQLVDPTNYVELPTQRETFSDIDGTFSFTGAYSFNLYSMSFNRGAINGTIAPDRESTTFSGHGSFFYFHKRLANFEKRAGLRQMTKISNVLYAYLPTGNERFVSERTRIGKAITIPVRSTGQPPITSKTPDWSGPWTFNWIEAITGLDDE